MASAIIKCPKCGQIYNVVPEDLNKGQLVYHCNKCNNDFQVEYFDYCPKCKLNIGFVETGSFTDDMKNLCLDTIKIAVKPISAISSLGSLLLDAFDKRVKDSNGDGICPICKQRYLRCPHCLELFPIKRQTIFKDKCECPHCGGFVMPCHTDKLYRNKHSRKFYNK